MIFHGRFSGTEEGWMLFEDPQGNCWEETAGEWEEIIVLTNGRTYYRRKADGQIAESAL